MLTFTSTGPASERLFAMAVSEMRLWLGNYRLWQPWHQAEADDLVSTLCLNPMLSEDGLCHLVIRALEEHFIDYLPPWERRAIRNRLAV